LGWRIWTPTPRQPFYNCKIYTKLFSYVRCLPINPKTNSTSKENKKLNKWIYKQKNRYNKGKLSQERIDLLKQLNVNFD